MSQQFTVLVFGDQSNLRLMNRPSVRVPFSLTFTRIPGREEGSKWGNGPWFRTLARRWRPSGSSTSRKQSDNGLEAPSRFNCIGESDSFTDCPMATKWQNGTFCQVPIEQQPGQTHQILDDSFFNAEGAPYQPSATPKAGMVPHRWRFGMLFRIAILMRLP